MKTLTLTSAALLLAASSASGVFQIFDGNAEMRSALTPFLPDSPLCTADFRCDGLASPDHMFGYNWSYRAPGGGNRGFSWLDTPVQTMVGDTLTLVYTNAGPNPVGFNRFNARLTVQIFDAFQPNTARCESTLDFQAAATNAGPTVWNIFHLADMDLNGTAGNDVYQMTPATNAEGVIGEGGSTDRINFLARNPARFQVGPGAVLRNGVIGGGLFDLNGTANFAGDGAYAFQWLVTLLPGQTIQFKSAFGVNMPAVPPACPEDLNGDGQRDVNDLVLFLANFGTVVPPFTGGDIDGNGVVNVVDLTLFLATFGVPC
ncbi:MAG: hypothetical protein ACKVZJ_07915 [Phycisphaerales bacterium]